MPTVYELRQYTLRPGTRDAFIAHFDEHFVESQEAAGIQVVGQFRDLDRPDMFVWIRGFADMATRRDGLEQFYTGPAWRARGQLANSMMLDSDNVLLLKPTHLPVRTGTPRPVHGRPSAARHCPPPCSKSASTP